MKKLDEPKTSLREWFDRLRKLCEKEVEHININKYMAKIIHINIKTAKNRNGREKLMKVFFYWRALSKTDEKYYPKINNLLTTIAKNIKKNAVKDPFEIRQ